MKPSLSPRELQTGAASRQSSSPGAGCVAMVSLYLGHSLPSNVLPPHFVPREQAGRAALFTFITLLA